jgi:hypothetical protein
MEKIWIIIIATAIFLIINFLFYISLNGYVKKEYGKKAEIWINSKRLLIHFQDEENGIMFKD